MIENWLTKNIYGYSKLSSDLKQSIYHFSMIWSLFECYLFENSFSVNKVLEKEIIITKPEEIYLPAYEYFKSRYIDGNGNTNKIFERLNFRGNDRKEYVVENLLDDSPDIIDTVKTMIIIIYRLRNNLFHGLKWDIDFEDQRDNFIHAARVMTKIIELN